MPDAPAPLPGSLAANLRRLREAKGWSQAELARRVGVTQTTIDKIESGATRKSRFLADIAREFGVTLAELDPSFAPGADPAGPAFIPKGELVGAKDLPVYASTEGGEGTVIFELEPVDFVKRPAPLLHVRDGYAMIVSGESMVPAYRPGELALVNPRLSPLQDDVCLFFRVEDGMHISTIKEYRGQNAGQWKVRRYSPKQQDFTLNKLEWPHCNVVVGKYRRR